MSHVTVPDDIPLRSYSVGGAPTSAFAVPFPFFEVSDIKVMVGGALATFATSPANSGQFNVDATAVDGGFSGGTVQLGGTVTNTTVIVWRDIPAARATDFPYPSDTLAILALNTELDRIIAIAQQHRRGLGRALRLRIDDPTADYELPLPADRAGKVLAGAAVTGALEWINPAPQGDPGEDGDDGAPGSRWHYFVGSPSNTVGNDGDFGLRDSGLVYEKIAGAYVAVGLNLTGPPGAPGDGSGDVVGPTVSANGHAAVFSGTSGKIIASAGITLGSLASLNSVGGTQIDNDAVANGKLANMAAGTLKGNNATISADPADLTATQVTAMLDVVGAGSTVAAGTKGLVPAPDAGDAAAGKVLTPSGWASSPGNSIEPGSWMGFLGAVAPTGWAFMDGAERPRTDALYGVIGTAHGAGNGTTTYNLPDWRGVTFVGAGAGSFVSTISGVVAATDIITTSAAHGFFTGQALVYGVSGGSAPGGLANATTYFAIVLSATTLKLATTRAAAIAGTAINITSTGSGVQTLTYALTPRTLNARGGAEDHALTIDEIPAHGGHVVSGTDIPNTGEGVFSGTSQAIGGSGSHNNMPPFRVSNFIIKL